MDNLLVLTLLIEKYKLDNNCQEMPENFNILPTEDKLIIINKALKENIKVEKLISN